MKELQDQLEAEQYFSVSALFIHGTEEAHSVLSQYSTVNYCQSNIPFILITKSSVE